MRRSALLIVMAAAIGAAGCFRAQARTPSPPAPLVTPVPPDRIIVRVPVPEPIEEESEPTPVAAGPANPPRTQPAARPPSDRQTPAPPAAPAPVANAEPPASPPVLLQSTSNPSEVAQRANDLIAVAKRDLAMINPASLSANAKAQYESARGFVRQAESAIKVRNVVLARELADKAAALASQLRR